MSKLQNFRDGLTDVFNSLVNRRNALTQNRFVHHRLDDESMRAIYKSGIGNKIVRFKAGHALANTLQFESSRDREFYEARLAGHVKQAAKFMLAFGRGVIVLYEQDADLSKPLSPEVEPESLSCKTFSGDMVTVGHVSHDLTDERYYKPVYYQIRGHSVHHSRVVDFTYVEPVEMDAPEYRYGGISEFELIHEQLINDGIVERASARIIERNSSFVYRVAGFKDALRSKQDQGIVDYFGKVEDMRSIYGAALVDKEDEVSSVDQALTNLSEADQIGLRRLAMVTGIALAQLVGENVRGMNATGENEMKVTQDMLEQLQQDYLLGPINNLARVFGLGAIGFRDNQGETPSARMAYETQAVENAAKLHAMGEDANKYLQERGILEPDAWDTFWQSNGGEAEEPTEAPGLPDMEAESANIER
jgi:hypothetical protein